MPITKQALERSAEEYLLASPFNRISAAEALSPELASMRIYDAPLWGYADAGDPLFARLQAPEAVGPQFLLPGQWLEGARTVLSFFLPFTDEVKRSNRSPGAEISPQWFHGRIEGQRMVAKLAGFISSLLAGHGVNSVVPSADARFKSVTAPDPKVWGGASFTSNWSERHVAYICGLGTFGLSKGLITARGMAGRFGSLVLDIALEPTERAYSGLYDYCIRCGACVRRCPAGAISLEHGKDHVKCAMFVVGTRMKDAPYYGCGKCQTGVPCESGIPPRP